YTVAKFVGDHMGEQRRRGERAREALGRHGRGLDDRLAAGVGGAVLDARDDQAAHTAALPGEPAALFEADTLGLALGDELVEERVGDLDALLFERELLQVATAGRLARLALRRRCAARLGCWRWRLAAEAIERGERGGELQLQLRRVDALGLGHEDAPAQQLE